MHTSLTTSPRFFTVRYRHHELRVVVDEEVRFTTGDICKVAGIQSAPGLATSRTSSHTCSTVPHFSASDTVGWSEALNLIDTGTLAPDELQQFADWFLSDIIQILCEEGMLTGEEIIDTSLVQYSGFFRRAFEAASDGGQGRTYLLH